MLVLDDLSFFWVNSHIKRTPKLKLYERFHRQRELVYSAQTGERKQEINHHRNPSLRCSVCWRQSIPYVQKRCYRHHEVPPVLNIYYEPVWPNLQLRMRILTLAEPKPQLTTPCFPPPSTVNGPKLSPWQKSVPKLYRQSMSSVIWSFIEK